MRQTALAGGVLLVVLILQYPPKPDSNCCRPARTQIRYAPERHHHRQTYISRAAVVEGKFSLQIEAPSPDEGTSDHWRTNDYGRTWTRTGEAPSNLGVFNSPIAEATSDPRVVYRISNELGFLYLRSEDGGDTWLLPRYAIEGASKEDFAYAVSKSRSYHVLFRLAAICPRDPLTLYAGIEVVQWANSLIRLRPFGDIYLPGLYTSHDGGETWNKFTDELSSLRPLGINPANPNMMYGQGRNGVLKSTNGGKNWTQVGQEDGLLTSIKFQGEKTEEQEQRERLGKKELEIRQFAFDPSDESVLYIVSNKGIYRTLDGGKTWCLLDLGFDEVNAVNSMALNPAKPREILLGTAYGIFFSNDQGCHSQKIWPPPAKRER